MDTGAIANNVPDLDDPPEMVTDTGERLHFHPVLRGDVCDQNGNPVPVGTPPMPLADINNPWSPFQTEASFRLADHLFRKAEMSKANVNELLDI
ncbi:hypothetical protein PQX77_018070 [Marasmius sp. AFHP31]|nr:hypothetical protein PQX77_018070 [Marasmius sp. AFHP31]